MPKTLVIAEKPSVGRDLARVLPGPFAKHEGYLEGPEHVLT
ncbi:MAG: topoisomerase, partial [Solirubrobacteraceae bacterium]|nr:topoisomerase [Solirubrobacteraceae bacterium]